MKRKCETCTHFNCFINKYCSPEWKPLINHYKVTDDYTPGSVIFSEGDSVKGIFQIYTGKIKVVSSYKTNSERIVRLAKTEEILGHRGLGGKMIYPVTAIALEKSQVTFIPIDIFYKTIKANPELSFNLLMFYADEFKTSEKRMKPMGLMMAKEKVAASILMIIKAFGFDKKDTQLLSYTPSRKEISAIAGITYETVIRELSILEKSGVIITKGKSLRILNKEYLEELCNNESF